MFRDVPVFRCSGVPVFLEVLHAVRSHGELAFCVYDLYRSVFAGFS